MLIGGIVLGLVLGLLSGGRFSNLALIRLRWTGLLIAAVVVRFGTEILLEQGVAVVDALRIPLLVLGFGLLLVALWANRGYPGLGLAFIGILLNSLVILVNGGYMPIWATSLTAAGLSPVDVTSALHVVLPGDASDFLVHLLIIGDVIPIPVPPVQNVASLGDLFITLGLAFFLFASVVRVPTELEEREEAAIRQRLEGIAASTRSTRIAREPGATTVAPATGLAPALNEAASLERPVMLGSQGTGMAAPALAPLPPGRVEPQALGTDESALAGGSMSAAAGPSASAGLDAAAPPVTIPLPSPETLERVRRHPYVRLALNGSFSALWAGQLISLFGDRIHQIALAAVVLITTESVLASALVFVAATLPNLLLSPVAGTLVDRWDHKEVLVVSDLLRAAIVLLIPIAIATNVYLVYPLVFLITTISIFFRPARVAILPQIVRQDELLSANSALWVGETMADIIGLSLAGLFVATLGNALPVAFWLDSATYIASAALLSAVVVRSVGQRSDQPDVAVDADGQVDAIDAGVQTTGDENAVDRPPSPAPVSGREGFLGELKAGWRFLRDEPVLLANTLQATVAQVTVGVLIALTPAYARSVFGTDPLGWEAIYAFLEASQGVGALIGGFLVGLVGTRFAKGRMIIAGYAFFGFMIFLFGLTGNLPLALGFTFGSGISNMIFLIPSQTLFQERTPPQLMGRVVGFRFALVSGAMTLAMGAGGLLGEWVGVTVVIAVSGLIAMTAGLAGMFVPAVRDA